MACDKRSWTLVLLLGVLFMTSFLPSVTANATEQTVELAYDDGRSERWWSKREAGVGGYDVVLFSPPFRMSRILRVRYYITDKPTSFNVLILDSDRDSIYEATTSPPPTKTGWFTVDLSDTFVIVEGEFYAAMKWIFAEAPHLGTDETDPDGRSFFVDNGHWSTYREIRLDVTKVDHDGDFMIRVTVEVPKDSDGDGLYDFQEAKLRTNPNNPDTDGDGLSDHDEVKLGTDPTKSDTDGDGLSDSEETSSDPLKPDTDSDGLKDGEEVKTYRTDPRLGDTDNDGLSDSQEVQKYGTNPAERDTDADGLDDGTEVGKGTDPKVPDSDTDGLKDGDEVYRHRTNPLNADVDGDGLKDGEEVAKSTDPLRADTDGDYWNDSVDMQPTSALIPNALAIIAVIVMVGIVVALALRKRKAPMQTPVASIPPPPPAQVATGERYCINCGAQIAESTKFCPKCGAQQKTPT